jgi:regulator of sigma D
MAMLEHSSQTMIRYAGRDAVLDQWLLHRQWMIAGYCELVRQLPENHPSSEAIGHWCAELLDYLSASHFKVFAELSAHRNPCDASGLYEQVTRITKQLVQAQDDLLQTSDVQRLAKRLSHIGELLAAQLDLEDQWLHQLLSP